MRVVVLFDGGRLAFDLPDGATFRDAKEAPCRDHMEFSQFHLVKEQVELFPGFVAVSAEPVVFTLQKGIGPVAVAQRLVGIDPGHGSCARSRGCAQ